MLGRKRTPISTSQRHSIYATSVAGASGTTGHGTGSRQYSTRGLRCTTGNRPLCTQADSTLKKARQRHQGKHTRDISLLITNHINGWKRAKERTSSGRSGVHFGHFMAGAKHTGIATFDATMAQIPYQTGYSPKIWQHGVNVMLVKKKGDYRVSKLRAILLYEADFNQNNKRLGREMMYYAEDLKNIAPEPQEPYCN